MIGALWKAWRKWRARRAVERAAARVSQERGRELLEEVERRTRFGFTEAQAFGRAIGALVDDATRLGTEQALADCNADMAFLAVELKARAQRRRALAHVSQDG